MRNAEWNQRRLSQTHAVLTRLLGSQYMLYAIAIHLGMLALLGSLVVLRNQRPLPVFQSLPKLWTDSIGPVLPPPDKRPVREEPTNHKEQFPHGPIIPTDLSKGPIEAITSHTPAWKPPGST